MIATLTSAILLIVVAVRHKSAVAGAITGRAGAENVPLWRRILARLWHVIAILYIVVAWFVSALRLVLDMPSANASSDLRWPSCCSP